MGLTFFVRVGVGSLPFGVRSRQEQSGLNQLLCFLSFFFFISWDNLHLLYVFYFLLFYFTSLTMHGRNDGWWIDPDRLDCSFQRRGSSSLQILQPSWNVNNRLQRIDLHPKPFPQSFTSSLLPTHIFILGFTFGDIFIDSCLVLHLHTGIQRNWDPD